MSNKFIQDNIDIVKLFEELSLRKEYGRLISLIPELMKEYPRCVSSIITKLNSSFGLHTVYIVNTNIGIKIGYTINTIQQRLNEGRYKEQIILKSILRDDRFPALGAFDFEKELKNKYSQYRNLNSNTTAPGKNEIYYFKFEKNILKIYDELKNKYKHKRGFKRAN